MRLADPRTDVRLVNVPIDRKTFRDYHDAMLYGHSIEKELYVNLYETTYSDHVRVQLTLVTQPQCLVKLDIRDLETGRGVVTEIRGLSHFAEVEFQDHTYKVTLNPI